MSDRLVLERMMCGPVAGVALAAEWGITRGAVWKRIQALREAGIDIASSREGYRLVRPVELLDRERIIAAFNDKTRAALASLTLDFETDSTQARALARPAPAVGCAIWLAERQIAGQGRRGRVWESPLAAHLYLSLARRFERGIAALSGLSLAVGVAVAQALRNQGFDTVGVKWPNDLLADGRKLGGILIQLRGEAQGPSEAVIGLGLNVAMPPSFAARIDQPWTDLSTLAPARVLSRNEMAALMITCLFAALDQFDQDGLAPFLPRWQALDALAGRPVRVLDGHEILEGVAVGIRDDGALKVSLVGGDRHFHSGEVSLRNA